MSVTGDSGCDPQVALMLVEGVLTRWYLRATSTCPLRFIDLCSINITCPSRQVEYKAVNSNKRRWHGSKEKGRVQMTSLGFDGELCTVPSRGKLQGWWAATELRGRAYV